MMLTLPIALPRALVLGALVAPACSRHTDIARDPPGEGVKSDAGADAGADSGAHDDTPDSSTQHDERTPDAGMGEPPPGRCRDAAYTTAPSGAPCDVQRFEQWNGLEGPCTGPRVGSACDELHLWVDESEEPPDNFGCEPPEDGSRKCSWVHDADASFSIPIDEPLLERACAILQALPDRTLYCMNFGS